MIDSDTESENETHSAGECSCASAEEWVEGNVSWKLEAFIGVWGVTIECDNWQTTSELTELIFDWPKYKLPATGVNVSAKIPWSVMS